MRINHPKHQILNLIRRKIDDDFYSEVNDVTGGLKELVVKHKGKTTKQYKFKHDEDWIPQKLARELGATPSTLPTKNED